MSDREALPVFRRSARGYNRDDVNKYIETLSGRCNEKLSESEKKLSEERAKKNEAASSLDRAVEQVNSLQTELDRLKAASEEQALTIKALSKEKESLAAENSSLRDSEASLRKKLEEQEKESKTIEAVKEENALLKSENTRLGAAAELKVGGVGISEARDRAAVILSEAESRAAAMLSKAGVDADLIVSRAEREASIIRLRGKAQKEELSNVIDRELSAVFGSLCDGYGENMNSALVGISNLYNKLCGDSSDYCDKMVRERQKILSEIKEKLLRVIEQTGASASDANDR